MVTPSTVMPWTHYRARIAATLRADPAADVTDLRRLYAEARLRAAIEAGLNDAPPLSQEQRLRLAALLTAPRRRKVA